MRIHTNTLTSSDICKAAELARADIETLTSHGSRSRDHAFDVKLTGLSKRRPNGGSYGAGDDYAATWDQWGLFLGYLYSLDDSLMSTYYLTRESFNRETSDRFNVDAGFDPAEPGFPLDHDHRFKYVAPRVECVKPGCTATQVYSAGEVA